MAAEHVGEALSLGVGMSTREVALEEMMGASAKMVTALGGLVEQNVKRIAALTGQSEEAVNLELMATDDGRAFQRALATVRASADAMTQGAHA